MTTMQGNKSPRTFAVTVEYPLEAHGTDPPALGTIRDICNQYSASGNQINDNDPYICKWQMDSWQQAVECLDKLCNAIERTQSLAVGAKYWFGIQVEGFIGGFPKGDAP